MSRKIIIAIDGPSSSGKSTLAKALARELGYVYVDSGSMYRAVALHFIRERIDLSQVDDVNAALESANISLQPVNSGTHAYLNGNDVEEEIRKMEVTKLVSQVSTIPSVRESMVRLQHEMAKARGIVMDGRDIGTVVFPDAELKIFMTADPEVRVNRRFKELHERGLIVTKEEVRANLQHRDETDSTRALSPLLKAEDAIELDSSGLTEDEQLQWALAKANERIDNARPLTP